MATLLGSYYEDLEEKEEALILSIKDDKTNLDSESFSVDDYFRSLVREKPLDEFLETSNDLASQVKKLDTQIQSLVYQNYTKFISATETIKEMKTDLCVMEESMHKILPKLDRITICSRQLKGALHSRASTIEKLSHLKDILTELKLIAALPETLEAARLQDMIEVVRIYQTYKEFLETHKNLFPSIKCNAEKIYNEGLHSLRNEINSQSCIIDMTRCIAIIRCLRNEGDPDLLPLLVKLQKHNLYYCLSQISLTQPFEDLCAEIKQSVLTPALECFNAATELFDSYHIEEVFVQDLIERVSCVVTSSKATPSTIVEELKIFNLSFSTPSHFASLNYKLNSKCMSNFLSETKKNLVFQIQRLKDKNCVDKIIGEVEQTLLSTTISAFEDAEPFIAYADDKTQVLQIIKTAGAEFIALPENEVKSLQPPHTYLALRRLVRFSEAKILSSLNKRLSALYGYLTDVIVPNPNAHNLETTCINKYVLLTAKDIITVFASAIIDSDWIHQESPSDVRNVVEETIKLLRCVSKEATSLLDCNNNNNSSNNNSMMMSSSYYSPGEDRRIDRLFRSKKSQAELDMERILARKMPVYSTIIEPKIESIILAIVRIILKAIAQYVRDETFSKCGLQQLHVDMAFFTDTAKSSLNQQSASIVTALLEDILAIAVTRTIVPSHDGSSPLLDYASVDSICYQRRARFILD